MNEELPEPLTDHHDKRTTDKTPPLGEHVSKEARHRLVGICLLSTRKEYADMPLTGNKRKRGRPTTHHTLLATRLNVSPRTVRRWASGRDAIQSSDTNAEKLTELAYTHSPQETTLILRNDAERYWRTVEAWLGYMGSNSLTCPCPEKLTRPRTPHQPIPKEARQ
jgi:hypothetical protein